MSLLKEDHEKVKKNRPSTKSGAVQCGHLLPERLKWREAVHTSWG
ncbi:MAG: hypothetical protein ACXWXS_05945 [Actinomycetota bacterium]